MATTPPPPSTSMRTPPTPLHGARYDNYEAYPSRKSTRSAAQRARTLAVQTTPPPPSQFHDSNSLSLTPKTRRQLSRQQLSAVDTLSPPPSAQSSPWKKPGKTVPAEASKRRGSGRPNNDNTDFAIAASGISPTDSDSVPTIQSTDMDLSNGRAAEALPTPAKTPRKKSGQAAPGLKSTARILFPSRNDNVDEVMPSPQKKRAKKYKGFSLDSFAADQDENDKIAIFTDSKDRVPELDNSEENPFLALPATLPPNTTPGESQVRRMSKRRRIAHDAEVEETIKRDEGMIYVFRGKKVFRKFEAEPDEEDLPPPIDMPTDNETDLGIPASARRPLTRSSIKPRLLFPTATHRSTRQQLSAHPPTSADHGHTDEEAITDIDDAAMHPLPSSDIEPDASDDHARPKTPDLESSTPVSPPTTVQNKKRTGQVTKSSSPGPASVKHGRAKKAEKRVSPFAGWQRVKAPSHHSNESDEDLYSATKGKKRSGGALEKTTGMSKRTRSADHHV